MPSNNSLNKKGLTAIKEYGWSYKWSCVVRGKSRKKAKIPKSHVRQSKK